MREHCQPHAELGRSSADSNAGARAQPFADILMGSGRPSNRLKKNKNLIIALLIIVWTVHQWRRIIRFYHKAP